MMKEQSFTALDGERKVGIIWADGPAVRGLSHMRWVRCDGVFVLVGKNSKGQFVESITIPGDGEVGVTRDGDPYIASNDYTTGGGGGSS